VRATIPEYNIQNFNKDWNDGRAICALTNAVGENHRLYFAHAHTAAGEPWVLPTHRQMNPGAAARNAKVGIDTANQVLGIPKLIAPEDLAHPDVDDLRSSSAS
jgi:hypothetical protein